MESNSDKELRDKLRGIEVPFSPGAWEQMEAMLDKKRKPKAFIWWWTGGIAACLMLGAGIFGYLQFTADKGTRNVLSVNSEKQKKETINSEAKQPAFTNKPGSTSWNKKDIEPVSSKQPTSATGIPTNNASAGVSANHNVNRIEKKLNANPAKSANYIDPVTTKNSTDSKTHLNKKVKQAKNKQHELNAKLQRAYLSNISANEQPEGTELARTNSASPVNDLLAAANAQPATAADYMLLMAPGPLTSVATIDEEMKKKGEEATDLKKLKKKLEFNYSLGVSANITGTTFGDHKMSPLFYKTPSYMLGITEDFMFLKRIAVTTGIMFSQTSFSDETFAYTCKITELNIPIGLKAYIISKPKIRFYVGTGIINHIKLKEKFTPLDVDPNPTNLANYVPSSLGISSNSFSGQYQSQIGRFSINNGKRYYASYYANAGVEFIVKKQLVFFTEPLFYMGLEKISSANKYKYNLGLSGGLRYQF